MKIALLGQFGSGNSGNDGSLEAMLGFLRSACPDAALLCICSNPAAIRERFRLDVTGLRARTALFPPTRRWLDSRLGRNIGRLLGLASILRILGDVDVMVIPGTGILDDFQEAPFGWPFIVYWWCFAARLRGTRIAFVSIGAGPIRGGLSRWFLTSAARMASYRSYRDDFSLRYVQGLGIDTDSDHRFPDLAFGLQEPAQSGAVRDRQKPATVGIGVMQYRGWERDHANADAIYTTYIAKIATLTRRLLDGGRDVRLFMGDRADEKALDDILATLPQGNGAGHLSATRTASLQAVMGEVLKVDMAIVSRFHNLLCALKLGRPTLSLGYAEKNDELMAAFDRAEFCQHIECFDVDQVLRQVDIVLDDLTAAESAISRHNIAIRAELRRQEDLLLAEVLVDRRGNALPLVQDALR
ncbi:polysaccharide pyruvyl transferase family protein (plasmid) [Shinella sp. H4-D48]|uniref:polysaccharide pyruvyl transferase family protein n=1 Tax=Shinella sp. H4-D48 TaxID=2925841 RepID=UPI001F53E127|nr:polysaccharide pyruvyl transferase family protein [Shinella sp. H4-D48]UNK40450.1 polysaccharide pyruvyl transferase family protein [Shinella sp. H4-D48]